MGRLRHHAKPLRFPKILQSQISDTTAAIKADRLWKIVQREKGHDTQILEVLANRHGSIEPGIRLWSRILRLHEVIPDSTVCFFKSNGEQQQEGHDKRTKAVLLTGLFVDQFNHSNQRLLLGSHLFKRSEFRNGSKGDGKLVLTPNLYLTHHAVQRLFQRGYGLTKDGEIDIGEFINILKLVWSAFYEALQSENAKFGAEEIVGVKASIYCQGYEFIVGCESEFTITLITLVDAKKSASRNRHIKLAKDLGISEEKLDDYILSTFESSVQDMEEVE